MNRAARLRHRVALVVLAAGCTPTNELPPPPALVPAGGTVTLDGKPLQGAVVTFLNLDERGTLSVAETDAAGAYRLHHLGGNGTAAGPYRVAVSYLTGTEGQVIGLARRSTTSPTAEMTTAKERLPARYSDLGRTVLKASVPQGGGTFPFALEGPLLDPPAPKAGEPSAED